MKLLDALRRSLGWKLLISYLLIIVVAFVVLAATANFHAVTAIQHHIADMEAALRGGPQQASDLNASFHAAVNEVILVATLAGIAAAVIVSAITTRRIIGPLQAMTQASRRIAGGIIINASRRSALMNWVIWLCLSTAWPRPWNRPSSAAWS